MLLNFLVILVCFVPLCYFSTSKLDIEVNSYRNSIRTKLNNINILSKWTSDSL